MVSCVYKYVSKSVGCVWSDICARVSTFVAVLFWVTVSAFGN